MLVNRDLQNFKELDYIIKRYNLKARNESINKGPENPVEEVSNEIIENTENIENTEENNSKVENSNIVQEEEENVEEVYTIKIFRRKKSRLILKKLKKELPS
jgi:hypothetical protein